MTRSNKVMPCIPISWCHVPFQPPTPIMGGGVIIDTHHHHITAYIVQFLRCFVSVVRLYKEVSNEYVFL